MYLANAEHVIDRVNLSTSMMMNHWRGLRRLDTILLGRLGSLQRPAHYVWFIFLLRQQVWYCSPSCLFCIRTSATAGVCESCLFPAQPKRSIDFPRHSSADDRKNNSPPASAKNDSIVLDEPSQFRPALAVSSFFHPSILAIHKTNNCKPNNTVFTQPQTQ